MALLCETDSKSVKFMAACLPAGLELKVRGVGGLVRAA